MWRVDRHGLNNKLSHRQADRVTDTQTDTKRQWQADRGTDKQTDTKRRWQADRGTNKQTDTQRQWQADRGTDSVSDRPQDIRRLYVYRYYRHRHFLLLCCGLHNVRHFWTDTCKSTNPTNKKCPHTHARTHARTHAHVRTHARTHTHNQNNNNNNNKNSPKRQQTVKQEVDTSTSDKPDRVIRSESNHDELLGGPQCLSMRLMYANDAFDVRIW